MMNEVHEHTHYVFFLDLARYYTGKNNDFIVVVHSSKEAKLVFFEGFDLSTNDFSWFLLEQRESHVKADSFTILYIVLLHLLIGYNQHSWKRVFSYRIIANLILVLQFVN